MILIADSGSSVTNWVLADKKKTCTSFNTRGLNPYFNNSTEIEKEIKLNFPNDFPYTSITETYFYGAGCSSEKMNKIVHDGLSSCFTKSKIEVNHDLLAAARSLFGNNQGIAVILGTGANTCMYDGTRITKNVTSLGFILGDEGGGDYMGKLLIQEFLNEELPQDIHQKFFDQYRLTKEDILNAVYKKQSPNAFLASFSRFILENSGNERVHKIIQKSFRDLFTKHICKYKDYQNTTIRLTGSIAFHFQKYIKETAKEFNAKIDRIIQEPIHDLVKYHLHKKNQSL